MFPTICLTAVAMFCASPQPPVHLPIETLRTDADIADFVRRLSRATTERVLAHGVVKLERNAPLTIEGHGPVTVKGLRLLKSIARHQVPDLKSIGPNQTATLIVQTEADRPLTPEEITAIAEAKAVYAIFLEDPSDTTLATLGSSGSQVRSVDVTALSNNRVPIDAITCLANLKALDHLTLFLNSLPAAQIWKLSAFNTCPTLNDVSILLNEAAAPDLLSTLKAVRASLPKVERIAISSEHLRAEQHGADGEIVLRSWGPRKR